MKRPTAPTPRRRVSPTIALLLLGAAIATLAGCFWRGDERPRLATSTPIFSGHQEVTPGTSPTPVYIVEPGASAVAIEFCVSTEIDLHENWSAEFVLGSRDGWRYSSAPSRRAPGTVCFTRSIPTEKIGRVQGRNPEEPDEFLLYVRVLDDGRHQTEYFEFKLQVQERESFEATSSRRRRAAFCRGNSGRACEEYEDLLDNDGPRDPTPLSELRETLVEATGILLRADHQEDSQRAQLQREAERLLDCLRRNPVLESAPYRELYAMVWREVAELRLRQGNSRAAWEATLTAERAFTSIASEHRISSIDTQAKIASREGAVRYGVDRTERGLRECAEPLFLCPDRYLHLVRGNHAWQVSKDPLATEAELEAAKRYIQQAIARIREGIGDGDPPSLSLVNQLVNLAHVDQLLVGWSGCRNDDCEPEPESLERARDGLETLIEEGIVQREDLRPQELAGWIELIGLRHELARVRSSADRAREPLERLEANCSRLVRAHQRVRSGLSTEHVYSSPGLAVLAALCAGDAASLVADGSTDATRQAIWSRAHNHYEKAIEQASTVTKRKLEVPMAASHHANAYYGSAVALVGKLDAKSAWERLGRLDREILEGCPELGDDPTLRFRIFWVNDRIWILERDRRTGDIYPEDIPLTKEDLLRSHRDLVRLEAEVGLDYPEPMDPWGGPLAPLAEYIHKQTAQPPGEPVEIALYGTLQHFPIDALPLSTADDRTYLSETRTLALRPACSAAASAAEEDARTEPSPLFVFDPQENLPGSSALASWIEELYPNAEVLHGASATRKEVGARLGTARFFHIGSHGEYDPVFPRRSMLRLADEPWPLADFYDEAGAPTLPGLGLEFANLSACETGRAPTSAGSGLHGFGGAFARQGVRWTVASVSRIRDDIAQEFNEFFYRAIHEGKSAPEAYSDSLDKLRARYPQSPHLWIMLRLIASRVVDPGAEFASLGTPLRTGESEAAKGTP